MDPDVRVVLEYYRHLFPDFTLNHAIVYKLLWRILPTPIEDIQKETSMSIATIYKILHKLSESGLIHKTNFKPIGFYTINPIKDFNSHLKKTLSKLEKGAQQLENLLKNSSSQSEEIYLIKKDGGQQKLILKQNRETINDIQQITQIKNALEQQIKQVEKQKLKEYAVYK